MTDSINKAIVFGSQFAALLVVFLGSIMQPNAIFSARPGTNSGGVNATNAADSISLPQWQDPLIDFHNQRENDRKYNGQRQVLENQIAEMTRSLDQARRLSMAHDEHQQKLDSTWNHIQKMNRMWYRLGQITVPGWRVSAKKVMAKFAYFQLINQIDGLISPPKNGSNPEPVVPTPKSDGAVNPPSSAVSPRSAESKFEPSQLGPDVPDAQRQVVILNLIDSRSGQEPSEVRIRARFAITSTLGARWYRPEPRNHLNLLRLLLPSKRDQLPGAESANESTFIGHQQPVTTMTPPAGGEQNGSTAPPVAPLSLLEIPPPELVGYFENFRLSKLPESRFEPELVTVAWIDRRIFEESIQKEPHRSELKKMLCKTIGGIANFSIWIMAPVMIFSPF